MQDICWRFEDATPPFRAVEGRLGHQCHRETAQALTVFAGKDRDARRLLLRRENNHLQIVRAFFDLKQHAVKDETNALKVAITAKEQERAEPLHQQEQDQLG
jgi:hypothetical protein